MFPENLDVDHKKLMFEISTCLQIIYFIHKKQSIKWKFLNINILTQKHIFIK